MTAGKTIALVGMLSVIPIAIVAAWAVKLVRRVRQAKHQREWEREQERLTAVALASCDAAHLVPARGPLVDVHERLQAVLNSRKTEFSTWIYEVYDQIREETKDENGAFEKEYMCIETPRRQFCVLNLAERERFCLDEVFTVLRHVSLPQGFHLESWLENGLEGGGWSIFLASNGKTTIPLEEALVLDMSPESFWETALLLFESSQFFMHRHGYYGQRHIVYDLRSFLRTYVMIHGYDTGGMVFNQLTPEKQKLLGMDFNPVVECYGDVGIVYFTLFAPFGGFIRTKLSISRKQTGLSFEKETVDKIDYECEINY